MQAFVKLEKTMYEWFTEYSFLKHSCEINIRDQLEELHKLKNDDKSCNWDTTPYTENKHSIFQQQIKVYQVCLSYLINSQLLSHEECSTVEPYLKPSERSLFSFLHEHINRLHSLLSPLIQRYYFSETFEHDHCVYEVKMVTGTISGAITALRENMKRSLRQGDEIRLIADTAIYGDQDIEFEGVNIACIAPKIINVKEEGRLYITTDGKLLPHNPNREKASNGKKGTAGSNDKAGTPAADGMNGRYGNPGGHILLVANNLVHDEFVLSANGSRGDDGQDGGDGGDGWTMQRMVKRYDFIENGWIVMMLYSSVMVHLVKMVVQVEMLVVEVLLENLV